MKRRAEEEYVDVGEVRVVRETEKCFICAWTGADRERPVPKSQVDPDLIPEMGEGWEGTLLVTAWFATKVDEVQEETYVDVPGAVVLAEARSGKAIQVRVGNRPPSWVPVYAVARDSPVRYDGDSGTLRVLERVADEKGFGDSAAGGLSAGKDARRAPGESSNPDDKLPF